MILAHDEVHYQQRCDSPGCGVTHDDAPIKAISVTPEMLVLPACPGCGAVEVLRRHYASHELGHAPHPDSLVGTVFADTGGVVSEHTVGYHLEPHALTQRRRIHDLAAHPLLHGS